MKKIFPLSLLLIFSGIILFSCNSGLTGPAYTIKMQLNKNDTFNYNTNMNMQLNTAAMGQSMDMNMKMDARVTFTVLTATPENKELSLTYKKLSMSMDMGKAMPSGVNTDSIMNASMEKITGKSVFLDLSANNEITAVKGFDSLMIESGATEESKKMMEKMFSKDQMNNLFGIMFSMYPNKPVKVGETWTAKTKVNIANIDMKLNVTYKLIGVKDGFADIDVAGVIDGKGEMNQGGMSLGVSMSGNQNGMITIKMSDGYLQKGSYKMNIKADMEVMGQKVPMTMKGEYFLSN